MKKLLPFLLCIIILGCTLPSFVLAKPNDNRDNTETTSSTSTTTTTTTSTTQSTSPPVDLWFTFTYNETYDTIYIEWNADDANGLSVKNVQIVGTNYGKSVNDYTGSFPFSIDDEELKPGEYTIILEMDDGTIVNCDQKVERGGELRTNIELFSENNKLTAQVRDNYDRPVSGLIVYYYIGDIEFESVTTDSNGYAKFSNKLPADISDVHCVLNDQENLLASGQVIKYIGNEGWLINPSTTGTSSTKSTTTTKATTTRKINKTTTTTSSKPKPSETKNTLPIVTGAGTTKIVGDKIALNASFDSGIHKSFDYSPKDFAARARLLVHKDTYSNIIGNSSSSLMLLVQSSSMDITDQHISATISGKSKYSLFHAEDTLRIPVDLSMHIINNSLKIDTPVDLPSSEVTIELPIPKSMKKSSKYMISAASFDKNGITHLYETTVKDGVLIFNTNHVSSVVILGFETPVGFRSGTGVPLLAIGLISFGVLMLGGAGTLLYFFFLRKPAGEADFVNGFDPTSGYADSDMYEHDIVSSENADAAADRGVSLGSLLNKSEKEDN